MKHTNQVSPKSCVGAMAGQASKLLSAECPGWDSGTVGGVKSGAWSTNAAGPAIESFPPIHPLIPRLSPSSSLPLVERPWLHDLCTPGSNHHLFHLAACFPLLCLSVFSISNWRIGLCCLFVKDQFHLTLASWSCHSWPLLSIFSPLELGRPSPKSSTEHSDLWADYLTWNGGTPLLRWPRAMATTYEQLGEHRAHTDTLERALALVGQLA